MCCCACALEAMTASLLRLSRFVLEGDEGAEPNDADEDNSAAAWGGAEAGPEEPMSSDAETVSWDAAAEAVRLINALSEEPGNDESVEDAMAVSEAEGTDASVEGEDEGDTESMNSGDAEAEAGAQPSEGDEDEGDLGRWWLEGSDQGDDDEGRWYMLVPTEDECRCDGWSGQWVEGIGWVLEDKLTRIYNCNDA